jgi:hypothetical protein
LPKSCFSRKQTASNPETQPFSIVHQWQKPLMEQKISILPPQPSSFVSAQNAQILHNRQKTALDESKQPLTQKHDFPNCPTNAKTIDRTEKTLSKQNNSCDQRA